MFGQDHELMALFVTISCIGPSSLFVVWRGTGAWERFDGSVTPSTSDDYSASFPGLAKGGLRIPIALVTLNGYLISEASCHIFSSLTDRPTEIIGKVWFFILFITLKSAQLL